jgi:hypothetical protein
LLQQATGFFFGCNYCISNKYLVKPFGVGEDIFPIYIYSMSTKRGRGRPPKRSDSIKSESLLLRLEVSEKQTFAAAAGLAGVPVTVWIRERLRRAALQELETAGRPVPFLANMRLE